MLKSLLCICLAFCATATASSYRYVGPTDKQWMELACKVSPTSQNESMVCSMLHAGNRSQSVVGNMLRQLINQAGKPYRFLDCFILLLSLSFHIPLSSAEIFIEDCINYLGTNNLNPVTRADTTTLREWTKHLQFYRNLFEGQGSPAPGYGLELIERLAELESRKTTMCSPNQLLNRIYTEYGFTECAKELLNTESACRAERRIFDGLEKKPQHTAKQFVEDLNPKRFPDEETKKLIIKYFALVALTLRDSDSFAIKFIKEELSTSLHSAKMSELVSKTVQFRKLFKREMHDNFTKWLLKKVKTGSSFWKDVEYYTKEITGKDKYEPL